MYKNLSSFVGSLDQAGELMRINTFVDPILEIAEITDRVSKSEGGGKALLFENTGTGFAVLTNMMGSRRRISMALGVSSLDELTERIEMLFRSVLSSKQGVGDKLRMLPLLGEVSRWLPRNARGRGECQGVVLKGDDARLSLLPILKCWPHDGGRFVTLPLVHTIDPISGVRNVGMYRMQIVGDQRAGLHWHLHKTGERHYLEYQRQGKMMPISICLGGDPAYTYSATAPMPDNMDEYLLAGFIRRKAVTLVKSITNDIYVPSDCDFVIEGYVDPTENKFVEGPFGDHTGFYSLEDLYPVFHVTAITHRKGAIYPATIVGVPPQEDVYMALATEKIFLAPIRLALQPEINDLYMPQAGVAHNIAVVDIAKSYAGQSQKVASSMWGAGQMMFNKFMMVTSLPKGDNIRQEEVLSRLLRGVDPRKDVMFSQGILDVLDHTTAHIGVGGKMMIDATIERGQRRVFIPKELKFADGVEKIDATIAHQWSVVFLFCDRRAKVDVAGWIAANEIVGLNFLVLLDCAASSLSHQEMVWILAANADAARDVKIEGETVVVDGRSKIPNEEGMPERFPNVVTSSLETIALVDRRWSEYGFRAPIESPSLHYIPLLQSDKAQV